MPQEMGAGMKRRTFIARSAALLAMPSMVRAQGTEPTKRLAMVRPAGPVSNMTVNRARALSPFYRVFFDELGRLGYVEGQNLIVVWFSAEGHQDRYGAVVQQAIDSAPDVIFFTSATMLATIRPSIPVVLNSSDPIAWGFTTSLARPSGNITGTTNDSGLEIWGKRLSILREAAGSLKKPYFLALHFMWENRVGQAVRQAAEQLGLSLTPAILPVDLGEDTYAPIFEEMKATGADGLIVDPSNEIENYHQTIIALTVRHRLPAIYCQRAVVVDGGLLSYGTDFLDLFRVMAGQIAKIFGGTKPADIPYQQPNKYELIANVKAAQAIGLTLPPGLLSRADEVIE
jgi:putative ABC transport system substrate-binding protein